MPKIVTLRNGNGEIIQGIRGENSNFLVRGAHTKFAKNYL